MDKIHMKEQAKLAFEFIDKLYFEITYLIKEIEGLLKREDEILIIGRPGGYRVTVGSSSGLDYPDWWWYKQFSVFFVRENMTKITGGRTITSLQNNLKLLYLIVNLSDKDISSPKIAIGTLYGISCTSAESYKKFEDASVHYLGSIWDSVMNHPNFEEGSYEDKYLKFKTSFVIKDLFDFNSTQDIQKKLLEPVLKRFRSL